MRLQEALSLQPGVAKWVPVTLGVHKQLSALREGGRFSQLRNSLNVNEVDWEHVEKSESLRDALRVLGSPTEVRVMMDSSRGDGVRLSFPDAITRVDLLDLKRDVIVLISGLMVEFWSIDNWRAFLEKIAEQQEAALDAIESVRK